jgi:hypothetical protein
MIIEQIRYFISEDQKDEILQLRRQVTRIRSQLGLPGGRILLADPSPDGPAFIWQCGYEDESEMGLTEARLIGNAEYEAARNRLGQLAARVELEIYMADEVEGGEAESVEEVT